MYKSQHFKSRRVVSNKFNQFMNNVPIFEKPSTLLTLAKCVKNMKDEI